MLTRCIYMTKAQRSVSKQGQLQPHCNSKARSLSVQLLKWSILPMRAFSILTTHSEMFCESFLQLSTTYCKSWQEHQLLPSNTYSNGWQENLLPPFTTYSKGSQDRISNPFTISKSTRVACSIPPPPTLRAARITCLYLHHLF